MLKFRKIIFLSIFISVTIALIPGITECALPDPGTKSTTSFTGINSDYGPRNITSGTNPHIGIDYAIATGNKAYAVEGGSVGEIVIPMDKPQDSYIKIGNYRYLHMVYTHTSDYHFQVYKKDSQGKDNPPTNVICFRSGSGISLTTTKILGKNIGNSYSFKDPKTEETKTVQNSVSQTDWVFVAGSDNHLHLDYKNGTENPLKYVAHKDVQDPIITIRVLIVNEHGKIHQL